MATTPRDASGAWGGAMAAPETATGGSARDGEHTEVSESDDEWPDVASDHEDEAGMIWPAADSHGRGPEAQGRGSDDVVGSSGAEPFSTTTPSRAQN